MKVNRDGSFSFGVDGMLEGAIKSLNRATFEMLKANREVEKEWRLRDLRHSCGVKSPPLTIRMHTPVAIESSGEQSDGI